MNLRITQDAVGSTNSLIRLTCCVVFLSISALLGSSAAFAQKSASGQSTSDVYFVQGIAIYKTADMNFGAIVPGASGGTVTLSTSGGRAATGTVLLPSSQSFGDASFTVLGPPSLTYTLSLPTSITLNRQGGSGTMSVTNFVSSETPNGSLNSGGSSVVTVGATLNVGGSQTFGHYTGSFSVNVSYP